MRKLKRVELWKKGRVVKNFKKVELQGVLIHSHDLNRMVFQHHEQHFIQMGDFYYLPMVDLRLLFLDERKSRIYSTELDAENRQFFLAEQKHESFLALSQQKRKRSCLQRLDVDLPESLKPQSVGHMQSDEVNRISQDLKRVVLLQGQNLRIFLGYLDRQRHDLGLCTIFFAFQTRVWVSTPDNQLHID